MKTELPKIYTLEGEDFVNLVKSVSEFIEGFTDTVDNQDYLDLMDCKIHRVKNDDTGGVERVLEWGPKIYMRLLK